MTSSPRKHGVRLVILCGLVCLASLFSSFFPTIFDSDSPASISFYDSVAIITKKKSTMNENSEHKTTVTNNGMIESSSQSTMQPAVGMQQRDATDTIAPTVVEQEVLLTEKEYIIDDDDNDDDDDDRQTNATTTQPPVEMDNATTTTNTSTSLNTTRIRNEYSCPNAEYTRGRWVKKMKHSKKYVWKVDNPRSCWLQDWDPQLFCDTLAGRSLLIVGDSINRQFYHKLGEALKMPKPKSKTVKYGDKDIFVSHSSTICSNNNNNNNQSFTFLRNDHLDLNLEWKEGSFALPWLPKVGEQYQVVMLNTGAHATPPEKHRHILAALRDKLRELHTHTTNTTTAAATTSSSTSSATEFFVRTSPRGHIGCTKNDTEPMASENTTEWKRFFPDEQPSLSEELQLYKKYHYDWFPVNNAVWREFFDSERLLDVARLTELRPDGHAKPGVDCLHYRDTSLYETWCWLFLNALRGNL